MSLLSRQRRCYIAELFRVRFFKISNGRYIAYLSLTHETNKSRILTLRLLTSYIYIYIPIYGAPSKARNANVVYIWTYVWQR